MRLTARPLHFVISLMVIRVPLTRVTSTYQYPRRSVGLDVITTGHREVDSLSKVDEVVDRLLDR